MNTLKRGITLLTIFLLVVTIAAAFESEIRPVKDQIKINEEAEFTLLLTNTGSYTRAYDLYSLLLEWDIHTDPRSDSTVEVKKGEVKTVNIKARPTKITSSGNYVLELKVKERTTAEIKRIPLNVFVQSGIAMKQDYLPVILPQIEVPSLIDPRETVSIKVTLNNPYLIQIPELLIKFESKIINKEIAQSLAPQEKKTIEIPLEIPSDTLAQKDDLIITLIVNNQTLPDPVKKRIEIMEISDLKKNIIPTKSLLKTTKEVVFTNKGNVKYCCPLRVESSFLSNFFTSTEPNAKKEKVNDQRYFTWNIILEPNGTVTVTVTENYRPLFFIIVLTAIAIALYYIYRSPLLLKKQIVNISKLNIQGGKEAHSSISGLKIKIEIRNRSKSPLKELVIVDQIPHIASMAEEIDIGTLKPERNGSFLRWKINELEPKEERVLTYKIRYKLAISGIHSLPKASAKMKLKDKPSKTSSNVVRVGS